MVGFGSSDCAVTAAEDGENNGRDRSTVDDPGSDDDPVATDAAVPRSPKKSGVTRAPTR